MQRRIRSSLGLVALAFALGACADDATQPEQLKPSFTETFGHGRVFLVKFGPTGTTATFTISATGGSLPLGATVTIPACDSDLGPCPSYVVWQATDNEMRDVTITETSATGNVKLERINVISELEGTYNIWYPTDPTVTVKVSNDYRATVRFKNIAGEQPKLRVEKTASSGTVAAGSPMSFNMTVYSDGPGTATNVKLTDLLPGGAGVDWSTTSPNCTVDGVVGAQTLNCSFGDLAAGQTRTATVTSGTTGAECREYANTVVVNSDNHPDVNASAKITVYGCKPLIIRKTAVGSYKIPVTWQLVKSVTPTSHSGAPGEIAGSSTWTVTATRVEGAPYDHKVTGTITVINEAGEPTRNFAVSDIVNGVPATIVCPQTTAAGGETVVCTYSVAVANATSNTATVTVAGMPDVSVTVPVSYTSSFTGDQSVTLADPRFAYSQVISSSKTVTFPEPFPCPTDPAKYVNGTHNRTETNVATLKGDNTDLTRTAQVTITCTMPQNGETATGQGFPWINTQGAPGNWFMYTPWVTTSGHRGISTAATSTMPAGTNLIAGQHHIAGRITGVRGTTTSITITLNSDWGFLNEIGNVKINPMSCTTAQPYVQPGGFTVHKNGSGNAITVSGLPNTACYGIHVDVVER